MREPYYRTPPNGTRLPPDEVIFGSSLATREVRRRVEKVTAANVPVLITGESGTGKEIVARLIHARSFWKDGSFVKVSCPAIPGTLLESELFGYEKGAFTGAHATKTGRVELAHHGTLFLDEIAELDHGLQAKLLQVLQDGRFCRIGSQEETQVETRIVCATSRCLEEGIAAGSFRRDLFYRVNVVSLRMPPLRDRIDDVPLLVDYFLSVYNSRFEKNAPPFSPGTLRYLQSREWPGNIRELENCVARCVLLGVDEALGMEFAERPKAFHSILTEGDEPVPLRGLAKKAIREMERQVIHQALEANHWNRRKAAEVLRISYRTLLYKLRQPGFPQEPPLVDAAARAGSMANPESRGD